MKTNLFFVCKKTSDSLCEVVELAVDWNTGEEPYDVGCRMLSGEYEEIFGMFGRREYAENCYMITGKPSSTEYFTYF